MEEAAEEEGEAEEEAEKEHSPAWRRIWAALLEMLAACVEARPPPASH